MCDISFTHSYLYTLPSKNVTFRCVYTLLEGWAGRLVTTVAEQNNSFCYPTHRSNLFVSSKYIELF